MMITIQEYCLVDGVLAYTGSKYEIVNKILKYWFDDNGCLNYRVLGCKPVKLHSYGDSFTFHDRETDAINTLFDRLVDSGSYKLYKAF